MTDFSCQLSSRTCKYAFLLVSLALGASCMSQAYDHGEERALAPDEVKLQVHKAGTTGIESGNDVIECGGQIVWGWAVARESTVANVTRCLRSRGYQVREGAPPVYFVKDGASPGEERRDATACGGRFDQQTEAVIVEDLASYGRCMQAKGYVPALDPEG